MKKYFGVILFIFFLNSVFGFSQTQRKKIIQEQDYKEINPFENQEGFFTTIERFPMYPGGEEGIAEHIRITLEYPEEAKVQGIKGTVIVAYMIEVDGSIGAANVLQSVHALLDEEAIRVIKAMDVWKPAIQRGKPTRMMFQQAITFN
jgi:TonB family protein